MKTRRISELVGMLAIGSSPAGCCGAVQCDCDVSSASDVVLQLDADSLQNGFRAAEVRGAYVVRYARPGYLAPRDTARFRPIGSGAVGGPYFLVGLESLLWPVRAGGPPAAGLLDYDYRLLLPNANRTYEVSSLDVQTATASGCCACLVNTRRRFVLNGTPVVAEGRAAVTVLRR